MEPCTLPLTLRISSLQVILDILVETVLLERGWVTLSANFRGKGSPWPITWCCLRDPTFSRFETIPACNIQTDRQTHDDDYYSRIASSARVKIKSWLPEQLHRNEEITSLSACVLYSCLIFFMTLSSTWYVR